MASGFTSSDFDPAALVAANVNPVSGLATDYLNHFNEPIMLMTLAGSDPTILDEISGWRPLSYTAHFAKTGHSGADTVIAAYKSLSADDRSAFEAEADALCAALLAAIDDLTEALSCGENVGEIAMIVAQSLQEQVAALGARINGGAAEPTPDAQDAVDALFD